jgi:regulator of cell morphogenesis and NO signaling
MKLLTAKMKMADAIHANYLLIPVINRFGISLGFGEKTIENVCAEHDIDVDFFLAIINAFGNKNYFPESRLQTFSVIMIVKYLKKTHQYYRETLIPSIENWLELLLKKSSGKNKSLTVVKKFFDEFKKEFLAHLKREESVTFPYVEEIYKMYQPVQKSIKKKKLISYSMKIYKAEHDDIDEKLYDLKNILIKYINGNFDNAICSAIIFELFRLEKDMEDHSRIEDNILMPIVAEMEKSLRLVKV